jgi:hypothetical protein
MTNRDTAPTVCNNEGMKKPLLVLFDGKWNYRPYLESRRNCKFNKMIYLD